MKSLGELCEFIVDCEHKTAPIQEDGIPSIRTPNIGRGYFILDGVNRVSDATYDAWTRRAIPEPGDLILAREAPVGNVAVIPDDLKCCLGQRTVLIRPKRKDIDADYLCYLLLTPALQADLLGKSGGATVHHLNLKDIRALPISDLPELDKQRAQASVIKNYDDLIETNRRRIALLEESARLLYREWFVNLRFPGHEQAKVIDGFPGGWRQKTVDEMASFLSRGITPKYDEAAPGMVINQKCIRDGRLNLALARHQSKEVKADRLVQVGDILINSTGAGTLGRVAQVRAPIPDCTVDTHVTIVRPLDVDCAGFLGVALLEMESVLSTMGVGSTNQLELGRANIGAMCLSVPTGVLCKEFHDLVWPIFDQVETLSQTNSRLAQVRDELLPKLMSGEIQV
ncbi:MAG: restriction endonuclease subunit S [Thiobacillus sp.]|nr:restriction endonuclease subunit S [Thiobacillus sp.]MDP2979741.1 restriction endonuclease subunit S [Thiobacillus sp.]